MASLAEIRTAIKTTLEAKLPGVTCYDRVPASPNLPAVVVIPLSVEYADGLGPGSDDLWTFRLDILVSATEQDGGQRDLDAYVTGAGPSSVREALHTARTTGRPPRALGLPFVGRARVLRMDGYGLGYPAAGQIDHVGAALTVQLTASAIA